MMVPINKSKHLANLRRLSTQVAPYPAFVSVGIVALGVIKIGFGVDLGIAGWVSLIVLIVCFVTALFGPRSTAESTALILAALSMAATFLAFTERANLAPDSIAAVIGGSFVVVQFAMLCAFRFKPALYVALTLIIGWLVWKASASVPYALFAVLVAGATLAFSNYIIQFFLDHFDDFRSLLRKLDARASKRVLVRTIWLWLPALVLTNFGVQLNTGLQNELQRIVYDEWHLLNERPSSPYGHENAERDVLEDVLYTIDKHEAEMHARASQWVVHAINRGAVTSEELARESGHFVQGLRPSPVSTDHCDGMKIKLAKWTPGIPVGFICRGVINSVNEGIQSSFSRAAQRLEKLVKVRVAEAQAQSEQASIVVREALDLVIKNLADDVRAVARSSYGVLLILKFVGYLVLIGGLVGALQMILGRILFDARGEVTRNVSTFALGHGTVRTLQFSKHDEVRLNDPGLAGSDHGWWVYTLASRHGEGTHAIPRVPQPFASFLQRVFSGRFILTRVGTDHDSVRKASLERAPTISAPGDLQFVCIQLVPGGAVTFRMRDLIAFTDNVRLQSVYTTHVGANLLGLGSFYALAVVGAEDPADGTSETREATSKPKGTIILRSEGSRIEAAVSGQQLSAHALLAWDRCTQFSVKQQLGFVGVWLAPPHVQTHSERSVIYDEGEEGRLPIVRNVMRLFRYLFLPF